MALEPLHVPSLLKRFGLSPRKSLGQNFLVDHNALVKIVSDAGIGPEDRVLEIGAGLGSLTRLLADRAKSVTAIEIDENLFPALESVIQPFDNVRLIKGDILDIPPRSLFSENGYQVVANIPYYITSAVIRHLLEAEVMPEQITLTIQREVAERIISKDAKMSLLSLSVLVYGRPRIARHIPPECFYPRPQVESSVLMIAIDPEPKLSMEEIRWLFRLAHAAFNQKRKMLRNSLKPALPDGEASISSVLTDAGIDPRKRPEVLSLEDWIQLTRTAVKHFE